MQQLRPTDFREMWAHALTRTLVLQQEINNRLEQADAQTLDLLGQIPSFVEEVHKIFDETKQMQISMHREMQESVKNSIEVLKLIEKNLIAKEMEIAEFEKLGLIGKIGKLFWKRTEKGTES